MAITQNTYTGDGSTTNYTFTFEYIAESDIKITLDGTLTTAYSLANATTIQFDAAPSNGAAIRIYRVTNDSALAAQFYPGSAIRSQDLNDNFTQNLYVTQEINDNAVKTDGSNQMVGDLNMGGKEIFNIGPATVADSLVTKGYVDSYINTYYLGGYDIDPTTRPGGSPLSNGDYYVNLASYQFRYYNGTEWKDVDYNTEQDRLAAESAALSAASAQTASQLAQTQAEAAKVAAESAQTSSESAAGDAALAKAGAEAARDAAVVNSPVYPDEPTGRAAVADGEYFQVLGDAFSASFLFQRVDANASTFISSYPSTYYVDVAASGTNRLAVNLDDSGLRDYTGTGPIYPILTDKSNGVILGYDADNFEIVGDGVVNRSALASLPWYNYVGDGPVYPILTDSNNKVLLGYDEGYNSLLGQGILTGVSGAISGFFDYVGSGTVYPVLTDATNKIILGYDADTHELVGTAVDKLTAGSSTTVSTGTIVQLADPPIEKAVNHFLFYGQSLSVGAAAGSVISTTQPYSNITFQGGPRAYDGSQFSWAPFKPLVEDANKAPDGGTNRQETICSGAANYASRLMAIENGIYPSDHVILASTAGDGGEPIDDLDSDEPWYNNVFLEHVKQAAALEPDYAVHAVGWLQGENDNGAGTDIAVYKQKLVQLRSDAEAAIKNITGQSAPLYWITYQTCTRSNEAAPMLLPQLELAQTDPKFFLATPLYHIPHAGDAVHLTAAGYKWVGAYFGRAYKQLVIDKRPPEWLNPVSAFLIDGNIRIRFSVPTAPLVLDTTTLANTTDYGFRLVDSVGTVAIDSIAIEGDEVVITPAGSITGSLQVRYARDYLGTGLNINNGASGNLRDSTTDTVNVSGIERPLYHVCPHFQLTAIPIID